METIDTLDTQPFKNLVMSIGALPTSFVDSMSYYEALAWLVNYLQTQVIPAVNNNAEALSELQTAFITLKDYVDNYFDNLDVQEEINNKLDSMVEDGSLQIILQTVTGQVNVKSFGALGDNSTDDTEAFQDAIDYAIANNVNLFIDKGIYLVSKLTVNGKITLTGAGVYNSIIKSIDNNTNTDGLLTIENYGILNSVFKDFGINGNKDNQSSTFDGMLITLSNGFDTNAIIDTINITNCTGNGLSVDGYAREIRFSNISCSFNNLNGLSLVATTDNILDTILSFGNIKSGLYFYNAGATKVINSKFYQNGHSSEEFTEYNRLPDSAFSESSDETPQPDVKYFTRTGNGKWYNPYRYTLFTGDSFDGGTTYYKLINPNYMKKYAGICISNSRSFALSNIEVQDNGGDGIYCNMSRDITCSAIITDNNGLLKISGVNKKYSDYEMQPLYDGFHIDNGGYVTFNGIGRDFRGLDLGYTQRSVFGCDTAYQCNVNITSNNLASITSLKLPDMKNFHIIENGHEHEFVYDITDLTNVPSGYNIYDGSYDKSYIKRVGNRVTFRLMFTKTGGSIPVDVASLNMCKMPTGWYPAYMVNTFGFLSQDHGSHLNGMASIKITNDGWLTYVPASDTAKEYLVIQGGYDLSY